MGRDAAFRDLYEILGVPRGADAETLRSAYRRRARELHPEVSRAPDTDERFRELSHAYDVLSKPRSRVIYDRLAYREGDQNGGDGTDAERLGQDELIGWVFTEDRLDVEALAPPGDGLMRVLAGIALVVAIVLVAFLLLTNA